MRDKSFVRGKITATVIGPDGNVKRFSWRRRVYNFFHYLRLDPRMICVNHNIVTYIMMMLTMPIPS